MNGSIDARQEADSVHPAFYQGQNIRRRGSPPGSDGRALQLPRSSVERTNKGSVCKLLQIRLSRGRPWQAGGVRRRHSLSEEADAKLTDVTAVSKATLLGDPDFLKDIVRATLQEVLEAEIRRPWR